MTITAESRLNGPLPGDGADTTFDCTFRVYSSSDILVEHQDADGVLTELTENVDYTVALNSDQEGDPGATITYPISGTPLPSTENLILSGGTPYTQPTDLKNSGALREETIEQRFDQLVMQIQRMATQIRRFVKLPYDALDSTITDLATARADGILGFDSSGNIKVITTLMNASTLTLTSYMTSLVQASVASDGDFQTEIGISAFIQTLLDDADSATARTTLEVDHAIQNNEYTYFTTAGTAPNFTLTPSPAITGSLSAGQVFLASFHDDGTTGSNDLNVSALGAVLLKQYDSAMNKRPAIIKSGMKSPVLYDGTHLVVLCPLRIEPVSYVRQTVQAGPGDAIAPTFLPASTSGTLDLDSQNITSSLPLIVSAANGAGEGSDRLGETKVNITWSSLTPSSTCYLYVDVGSDGSLTPGHTTSAPVYQPEVATTTPSVTSGVHTFDYSKNVMYVGNGSSAATGYWRVFVGEAVTDGTQVTSTVAYAYNGTYHYEGSGGLSATTQYTITHNIGAPVKYDIELVCNATDQGFAVGDRVDPSNFNRSHSASTEEYNIGSYRPASDIYKQIICTLMADGVVVPSETIVGSAAQGTNSKWDLAVSVRRAF